MSCTDSFTERLDISAISPLFMVRIGRSLRFCHLEFYKQAISDVFKVFLGRGRGDFSELSFCGPCKPCFILISKYLYSMTFEKHLINMSTAQRTNVNNIHKNKAKKII